MWAKNTTTKSGPFKTDNNAQKLNNSKTTLRVLNTIFWTPKMVIKDTSKTPKRGSAPCVTTPIYKVLRARRITFFQVNRIENQNEPKRPQSGGRLGFQLGLRQTLALIIIRTSIMGHIEELLLKLSHNPSALLISASVCRRPSWKPKRTQTATTLWPFGFVLVFNSVH